MSTFFATLSGNILALQVERGGAGRGLLDRLTGCCTEQLRPASSLLLVRRRGEGRTFLPSLASIAALDLASKTGHGGAWRGGTGQGGAGGDRHCLAGWGRGGGCSRRTAINALIAVRLWSCCPITEAHRFNRRSRLIDRGTGGAGRGAHVTMSPHCQHRWRLTGESAHLCPGGAWRGLMSLQRATSVSLWHTGEVSRAPGG